MGKKIVVISSSLRKDGNTEALIKEFVRGAEDAGNEVEKINLRDIRLEFCRGCLHCQKMDSECVIDDDMKGLIDVIAGADVLAFASPLYYGCISGQLKTFLDRLNPLFAREYNFSDVIFIGACADDNEEAFDTAIKEISAWADCFCDIKLRPPVLACNVTEIGDIKGSYDLERAYIAGNLIH